NLSATRASRQIKTFLQKAIHGAHRIGQFWTKIPGYKEHAICQHCNMTESLEHILFECQQPGQSEVWKLATDLWAMKHGKLPPPSMGGILGCCLTSFEQESKTKPSGPAKPAANRLYLIWKLRCESVIGRDGKAHSVAEIHNRWVHMLNDRLEVDRFMAYKYSHQNKKLVLPSLVL
ncbi:hypothetical protein C8R44DRAFT_607147, partial [Mycena epipterygia]